MHHTLIRQMKEYAGLSLAKAVGQLNGSNVTEAVLANSWHQTLGQNPDIYKEGWYAPPPHGISVLFGKSADKYARVCQPSFRPQNLWPQENLVYDKEDIISFYASPVHRKTNLIGDFGVSCYQGTDSHIHAHFENVLKTTIAIAKHVSVGMKFCDVYAWAMDYAGKQGFLNDIRSSVDITGTNIGHTIPLSYASDPTHQEIGKATSFQDVCEAIRKGRKFINSEETQPIEKDMAFTIEPRLSTADLPNAWFHLTVIFKDGQKEIAHGFAPVFERFGMSRLLKFVV